jgi:DNA-binding GntR family transcriptional regulator
MAARPAKQTLRPRNDPRLQRQGSGHQAANYIRQLIFDGELPPGTRVPQEEIARSLGISRIPVREALVALEKEGRVTIEMHRGAFVNALTEQSVKDNHELMSLIDGFVVRRAAERITPEMIVQLKDVVADIEATDDPMAMRRLYDEWKDLIIRAGSSPRLAQVLGGLRELVVENYYKAIPGALLNFRHGAVAISRAVARRDPEAAARAQLAMAKAGNELVIKFYRANRLFEETVS